MYQRSKVVFIPSACSESVKNSPAQRHSNRPASTVAHEAQLEHASTANRML